MKMEESQELIEKVKSFKSSLNPDQISFLAEMIRETKDNRWELFEILAEKLNVKL